MKVLIPEKFNKAGIAVLEDAGYEVTFKPDTTPEELVEMIPEYDALIVRSATTVTREVIEAGTKLKIIGRAGVGVDNIDREAETKRLTADLEYLEGFLASVMKKLSNERFVNSAPEKVVANERAKKADAEAKIAAIREQLAALK